MNQHTLDASKSIAPSPLRRARIIRRSSEIQAFDQAPDSAYVRLYVVCSLFACSPATVWRRVQDGIIPTPKKFGPRHTAWNVGQLREVLGI